ncbi:alpha/beta family hydrolase [Miltoncostaea marina]|uniref:alpha/beta hydrolase family protein n=1 Tax=Miltoncostaea marina TaxID=2843215 RepID=UPI001C3CC0B6|nr:alpha/beta family hydrolase [Miltoncostaea marina]
MSPPAGPAAAAGAERIEVATGHGTALVHLHRAERPAAALLMGHGAGGGVSAPDILAATEVGLGLGVSVALVEQPYRVAGRRTPPPAARLDAAWTAVAERLLGGELAGLPHLAGGRSSGARVACRTAAATGAAGVLCLAFPLQPRGRSGPPRPSRLPELEAVTVPVLVVQGVRDAFGMPPDAPGRTVARVDGDHRLAADLPAVRAAVAAWLPAPLAGPRPGRPGPGDGEGPAGAGPS